LSTAPNFIFRSFAPTGENLVSVQVSETLLQSQEHLAATRESIAKCMAGNNPTWRLHLIIENTQPFNVGFARLGKTAAMVRIVRGDIKAILILIADAAEDIDIRGMDTVQKAIREFADDVELAGAFDWITGSSPPLAALIYLTGKGDNGMDILAMCLANGFFEHG